MDIIQEEKIPYAPKNTKIKGKINFKVLKINSFIKTNLDFLNATNTAPINIKKRLKTIKIMKQIPKILFFNNANLGEKKSTLRTKIRLIKKAILPAKKKQELITRFLSLIRGRYLISPISNPNNDKATNNSAAANKVEASPTCSEENNLVLIVQKKNPKPVSITELAINHKVLPYK